MSTPLLNRDTSYWQELDRRHHLHPFSDMRTLNQEGSRMIERAEGVYIWDTDGNRLLDGMSGLWCVNMGYSQPKLVAAAAEQMQRLPYYNAFFKSAATPMAELAAKLAEVTPEGFEHVFFSSSGSEANDTVVRLLRYYWQQQGAHNKTVIVSRKNAYHGSTIAGFSLGGMAAMHAQGGPLLNDVVHIDQPYWYGEGGTQDEKDFGLACAQQLEQVIVEYGPDRVAGFIAEPIQGAGGVIVPPESYWPEIQRICRQYDILLVADEVICGFGRTGSWFGSQTLGVAPDLMTMAKGMSSGYMPISGVMVGARVAQAVCQDFGEFNHGYTYSGHPVACAVALANIELMQQTGIIETLQQKTVPYFQAMVKRVAEHPLVGDASGVGMLAGFALMKDAASKQFFDNSGEIGVRCRDFCLQRGVVMRAVGDRMVLSPPLIMTHAHINEMEVKIIQAFDDTLANL